MHFQLELLDLIACYSLDLNNNKRNPWFNEFWESHFKCDLLEDNDEALDCDVTECKDPHYAEVMLTQETYRRRVCTGNEVIGEGSSGKKYIF